MRIECDDWQAALDYFLNPRIIERMRRLGLDVAEMNWQDKTVTLSCSDDPCYADIMESLRAADMAEAETVAKPCDGSAVNTITSSAVL